MYGFICEENHTEWWVRRKEEGKSAIVISEEEFSIVKDKRIKTRIRHHELEYAVSMYCDCPGVVKKVAKESREKNQLGYERL